jgi:hypothetical protein
MTREVFPVAPTFLARLFYDSDPIYAVSTLTNIWSVRIGKDLPQLGLSRPEYVVQLCCTYSGQVGNGGHSQLFLNRGGRLLRDTLDALHETGLPELEASLAGAASLFPHGSVPDDPEEAEQAFDQLTEQCLIELGRIDDHAFRFLSRVDSQLLGYLRVNADQILVPETPLDSRLARRGT